MSKKCLIKKCMRTAGVDACGLCLICYNRAKIRVEDGETTWEKMIELGLCESNSQPFDDAYLQAMRDQ